MDKTRIIIVDDHEIYRKTLRLLLQGINNCEVVAEATNGKEFLEIIRYTPSVYKYKTSKD